MTVDVCPASWAIARSPSEAAVLVSDTDLARDATRWCEAVLAAPPYERVGIGAWQCGHTDIYGTTHECLDVRPDVELPCALDAAGQVRAPGTDSSCRSDDGETSRWDGTSVVLQQLPGLS